MPTIPQRTLAPRRNEGQHSANVVADTPPASPPAPTLRRAAAFPAAPARALNPPVITIATVNGIAPRSRSATPSSPSPVLDNDIADLPPEELARFLAELNLGYVCYDYTSHWSPLRTSSANFVDHPSTRPPRRVYDTEDVLFHALHRNAVSMSPAAPPPATPAASAAPPPLPATPTAPPPATPAVPLLSPATIYYEDDAPAALRAWRKQNRRDLLYVVAKGRHIGIFDSWYVRIRLVTPIVADLIVAGL